MKMTRRTALLAGALLPAVPSEKTWFSMQNHFDPCWKTGGPIVRLGASYELAGHFPERELNAFVLGMCRRIDAGEAVDVKVSRPNRIKEMIRARGRDPEMIVWG